MTECKTKYFDTVAIDVKSLCLEIQEFLNSKKVESITTFTLGRWLVLIAIFGNE